MTDCSESVDGAAGPRTNTLEDICDALGITLMELFSGAQRRALEGACER